MRKRRSFAELKWDFSQVVLSRFESLKFEVIRDFGDGMRRVEIKTLDQALAA